MRVRWACRLAGFALDLRPGSKAKRGVVSGYRISQLAERADVPAATLRYHEKVGLLAAARTPGGYRTYSDADAARVRFIAAAQRLGLPLDQIRDLLAVWTRGSCREDRDELRPAVAAQVAGAGSRIADLHAFRDGLAAALAHLDALPASDAACDAACAFPHSLPDPRQATPAIACSLDAASSVRVSPSGISSTGTRRRRSDPTGG